MSLAEGPILSSAFKEPASDFELALSGGRTALAPTGR